MPKSKRGRSLFELLDEEEGSASNAPGSLQRWGRLERPTAPVTSGIKTSGTQGSPPSERKAGPARALPFVEVEGDRFRVSFTSLTAAGAVFGLLVVLFVVFWLGGKAGYRRGYVSGRLSYEAQAVDEIEVARSQPPASYLVEGLLPELDVEEVGPTDGTAEADSAVEMPRWVRDHTYVVVQEFPNGNVEAANRARDFLATRGIATQLLRRVGGGLQLITTEGYNLKDPAQRQMAEELRRRVHAAGAQYYASGGGYRLEGYFKTLKGDGW